MVFGVVSGPPSPKQRSDLSRTEQYKSWVAAQLMATSTPGPIVLDSESDELGEVPGGAGR